MSALDELDAFLQVSPSCIEPWEVRTYLDAIRDENVKLREYIAKLEQANIVLDSDNTELRNDMRDMQMIVSDNNNLRELCEYLWGFAKTCGAYHPFLRELGIEVGE